MAWKSLKKTGLTQAAGAWIFDLKGFEDSYQYQIQVDVSSTPTAGSLAVYILTPGASDFVILDGVIDMTGTDLVATFESFCEQVKIIPTGFDGGKTYNVTLMLSDKK